MSRRVEECQNESAWGVDVGLINLSAGEGSGNGIPDNLTSGPYSFSLNMMVKPVG